MNLRWIPAVAPGLLSLPTAPRDARAEGCKDIHALNEPIRERGAELRVISARRADIRLKRLMDASFQAMGAHG